MLETALQRKQFIKTYLEIGKYTLSALVKQQADSRFAASVSIRSGTGTHTHDRVLRMAPRFDHHHDAIRFAMDEGLAWLHARGAAIH